MSSRSMNQYSGPRPSRAPASTKCQRCLHLGHYTYECTNKELPYKPRPSRTQQLLSGKAAAPRDKPSVETPAEFLPKKGTAERILEERERLRAERAAAERKARERSASSSSSSGSDSDSESDSGSSSSGSSRSRSPRRRRSDKGKARARSISSSRSRSRSPVGRAPRGKRDSRSASPSGRSRSRSPARR